MGLWPQSKHWVCVDWSQSGLHIWTLQFHSILFYWTARALSGCTEIGYEQPFKSQILYWIEVWIKLSSRVFIYFAAFILPSTFTRLPAPAAKEHPHSMMLPPPCFTMGTACLWWCAVAGIRQTYLLIWWSKSSVLLGVSFCLHGVMPLV